VEQALLRRVEVADLGRSAKACFLILVAFHGVAVRTLPPSKPVVVHVSCQDLEQLVPGLR
jgi:hypothetical protein